MRPISSEGVCGASPLENLKKEVQNFLLSFTEKHRKLRAAKESLASMTFCHISTLECTAFPPEPCAPSAPRECAGLRPSPPLRGFRCAPRRGARSAQRARNERASSEERASIGVAGRPFGPRGSVGGRQAVGSRPVGAAARGPRVAVGRRSVGSGRSALRAHPHRLRGSGRTRAAAPPRGGGPWRARPHRRGGVGGGARLRHSSRGRGALRR